LKTRRPKFFYGYIVALAVFLIMLVNGGAFYSFGVFFKPVLLEFGWTRVVVSGAYSLCLLLIGLLSIVMGKLNDRFGPRLLVTGCGLFLGSGYLLMSQIGTIWQLYLFYGVIVAIGESAYLVPLLSTVARWFTRRRGLATGIVSSGIGVGIMIMPPVVSWLISTYGWRTSYIIVGLIVLTLSILGAQFLRRDPGQIGLSPYGEDEVKQEGLNLEAGGLSLQEAIRTRQLWLLCALSFSYYFCTATIMVHIVIHATGLGISALSAANILAVIGGASIAGRIIMGGAGDRIGNKLALIICFILILIALIWLMTTKEAWMFYPFAAILGLGYGGIVALKPPVTAELFGLSSHGVILGITFFSDCMGGVIGPVLAGRIFDITGSYQLAFLGCIAIGVTGLVSTSTLRPINRERMKI